MTASTQRWHDLSFLVKGPVLGDLHHVFHSDWQFAAKRKTAHEDFLVPALAGATATLELVPSGPDVAGDPLYESVVTALFKARDRLWIVTPYFIPDEMLLKAICIAPSAAWMCASSCRGFPTTRLPIWCAELSQGGAGKRC